MDALLDVYPTLRAFWVVWFFLLFLVMLALVLRPSRKGHYEDMGNIPFRDGAPQRGSTVGRTD